MAFNPAHLMVAASTALNPGAPVTGISGPVYIATATQVALADTALRALFVGVAALTDELWLITKRRILLTYAFNGSSPFVVATLADTKLANENPQAANAAAEAVSMSTISTTIQQTCTIRRYCRFHAYYVWTYSVAQNFIMPLGARNGVPTAHGALGFDFVDGLHLLPSLSDAQRSIINLMKRVALREASNGPTLVSHDANNDHANSIEF
jgi:hypothetical protein